MRAFVILGVLLAAAGTVDAKGDSKKEPKPRTLRIQSRARPFGLAIADKVKLAGSDTKSSEFQKNTLTSVQALIRDKLGERIAVGDDAAIALDPKKLKLGTDAQVRVYFVGEGAGYHNTLGFTTDGPGALDKATDKLVFPDASSNNSSASWEIASKAKGRNRNAPLMPGDFVDLGSFDADTQLDFFLIANAVNGGKNTYWADAQANPDGINHMVAFAVDDSPYLVIGFEDLWGGGDRDFNDLLFVVDIGTANVAKLSGAPEPATVLVFLLFLGLFAVLVRRHTGWAR